MDTYNVPLIFVFIGNKFPDYGYDSIKFSYKHSNLKIIVLTNSKLNLKKFSNANVEIHNLDFYVSPQKLDDHLTNLKNFRQGFWTKTLERFHVLEQFCQKYNITRFFHSELDNISFNLDRLSRKIEAMNLKGVFLPRESITTMIGSLVYINRLDTLNKFNKFSLNDENMNLNEMEILSLFQNECDSMFTLPSTTNSQNLTFKFNLSCDEIGGIVDGNLYGRYFFGKDPRNVNGKVYNLFKHDRGGKIEWYSQKFGYTVYNHEYSIFIEDANKKIFFYNLHIHSKSIRRSFNNIERIILGLNSGSKTLILYNPLGYLRKIILLISIIKRHSFKNIKKIIFNHNSLIRIYCFFCRFFRLNLKKISLKTINTKIYYERIEWGLLVSNQIIICDINLVFAKIKDSAGSLIRTPLNQTPHYRIFRSLIMSQSPNEEDVNLYSIHSSNLERSYDDVIKYFQAFLFIIESPPSDVFLINNVVFENKKSEFAIIDGLHRLSAQYALGKEAVSVRVCCLSFSKTEFNY